MANYCSNVLTIKSDDSALVEKLVAIASPPQPGTVSRMLSRLVGKAIKKSESGLLEFLMPMPVELKSTISNGISGSTPPWQQWQVDNWGCAYDIAVDEIHRSDSTEVEFKFNSRYSPPVGAINHGANRYGFQFRLIYCEPGNEFAGIATEQDHNEFEFSFDVPPTDDGVPQEIVELFGLDAIYEEIRLDSLQNEQTR